MSAPPAAGRAAPGRGVVVCSVALVIFCVIAHLTLLSRTIAQTTPTVDEVAHLPAGYTYLDRGAFRLYRLSPPLARLLAATAAQSDRPTIPYDRSWVRDEPANHWRFAFETLLANAGSPEAQGRYLAAFTHARRATALVSAATIPVLFAWGWLSYGPAAGALAAVLWSFCPNVVAHAGLVTTDLAAAATGLWASFAFALWLARPTRPRAAAAGALLGVAQLVKFSSLWLYPVFAAWLLAAWWRRRAREPFPGRTVLTQGAAILLTSLVVIDAGYLFERVGEPLGRFAFLSRTLTRPRRQGDPPPPATTDPLYRRVMEQRVNRFAGTWTGGVPSPLPYHFVAGFDEQNFEAEGLYPMYLRGRFAEPPRPAQAAGKGAAAASRRGWWYYYLYALALKVPIGTWVLVVAAVAVAFARPSQASLFPIAALAAVPIAAVSFLTDLNLGLRYVLPALPFMFLLAGSMVADGRPRWCTALAALAVFANLVSLARVHPCELSYFNALAGGQERARWHLIDSNLDWGQDLRRLARWLDAHPDWGREMRLGYMGHVSPEFEGVRRYRLPPRDLRAVPDARLLPWEDRRRPDTWGPLPGRYAISVNFERGMPFRTPAPLAELAAIAASRPGALVGGSQMIDMPRDSLSWFQHLKPRIEPSVGPSILLYDVSLADANRARAAIGLAPLGNP